jgi:hypothetical protein
MQRSISTFLATLLLSAAILSASVYAQGGQTRQTSLNPYVANQPSTNQVSPFNLAYLAYRGYLKDQGIPSNNALIAALEAGTVTAQDVMKAAVKAHRLSEKTLTDQGYRFVLEGLLQEFTTD